MQKFIIISMAITALLLSCVSTGNQGHADPDQPPVKPKTVITLESKDAQLTTQDQLVYNEEADCVAWWEKTTDEISWNVEVKEAGDYFIIASVACDPQFPGSTVGVTVNNQTLTFTVPDTGGWLDFFNITVGKINLKPGTYPVLVKAIEVPDRFVANLRTLKFVK
ncbi:MAG: hypothetical protein JXB88_17830 [Spirochaetales bacterium]|nr:hypothetical protein [Spirochaetales bacterium]